jgi:hypothetical protein
MERALEESVGQNTRYRLQGMEVVVLKSRCRQQKIRSRHWPSAVSEQRVKTLIGVVGPKDSAR